MIFTSGAPNCFKHIELVSKTKKVMFIDPPPALNIMKGLSSLIIPLQISERTTWLIAASDSMMISKSFGS